MKTIAVLVSGGGSNLQSLIDAIESRHIRARIAVVVSDRPGAYALERARTAGIPAALLDRRDKAAFPDQESLDRALKAEMDKYNPDLIVLAGYLSILSPELVRAYRIINIHPSLIPKFCGMGYHGLKVHKAVLAAGESESGATVHFVDEGVDTGKILLQERVPVLAGDTAESLAARVLHVEHRIIVEAVKQLTNGL